MNTEDISLPGLPGPCCGWWLSSVEFGGVLCTWDLGWAAGQENGDGAQEIRAKGCYCISVLPNRRFCLYNVQTPACLDIRALDGRCVFV
jgi:hypothetical protein